MAIQIGDKIRRLRNSKNISQERLAKALGVSFQAVSKWETNTTTPDISIIPSIANYFDVSIDELFNYNIYEKQQKIDNFCREAVKYRFDDPIRAEVILREGLQKYPDNETILIVLVYVLCSIPGKENEIINTCKQLIECATIEGVKCDVFRILAETYHKTGEHDKIPAVLEQIPEFYFTKKECIAQLTEGQSSLDAAHFQMNISGKSLINMLNIMAKNYEALGENAKSKVSVKTNSV